MHKITTRLAVGAVLAGVAFSAAARVPKDLPMPSGEPSADELIRQVYFVNHFYALKNYSIQDVDDEITVLINRSEGDTPTTITIERYLNNDYPASDDINGQDLAIFKSGKLRGTGLLITDYSDDGKSQAYSIWLPALRKIRRFAEPAQDDAYGGTDFTFGDVALRKPEHETHELQGKTTFEDCLGSMEIAEADRNRYMQNLPQASCLHKGKEVYKLKSTTKFENWWYDYRISYVDTKTYADYRTEYFKGGNKVKVIDRDWVSLNQPDIRAQSWRYWYGKKFDTGHETWAVIPDKVVKINDDSLKPSLWSESTLRKIKR
ncbi:MAG: outer membrane lipoprotein-sorting protein [Chromatiales bacterium]|nr:outer membrane lipoprotein-sorting protein [Chromatiales bacterium]